MSSVPFPPSKREAQEECLFDSSAVSRPQPGMGDPIHIGGDGRNPIGRGFARMTSDDSHDDGISLNDRILGSMFDQAMNHPAYTAPGAKDARQKGGKPVLLLSHGEYSLIRK